MKILAIIPARMASSRFPGKPLKKINGKEMIKIIYQNVDKNKKLKDTIIATCDNEIKLFCIKNNMKYIMTSKKHVRASDRTAEAVIKYEKFNKTKIDLVVMIQGDEPMVDQKMIDMSIEPFKKNKKIKVSDLGDHRICMSAAILGLLSGFEVFIKNFETVGTSSPNFLKIVKQLGGSFEKKNV